MENLSNAQEKVAEFHREHPNAPRRLRFTDIPDLVFQPAFVLTEP